MYRLANDSANGTIFEFGVMVENEDPSAANEDVARSGICLEESPQDGFKPIDTESERRRLLRKLQTSSISNIGMKKGVLLGDEDEQTENKSMYSTKSVRVWWQRARQNIRKVSRKTKGQLKLGRFHWRKNEKRTEYGELPQSQLEAFFDMDAKSSASESRGSQKSRLFGSVKHDQDVHESKSVSSQRSLSSMLRPVFKNKKRRDRQVTPANSFTEEFSVEVQSVTNKARPTLTRQGSSFIRRLLRPKQELNVSSTQSWTGSYSVSFPDRLTPTTTDTTMSDTEDDEYLSIAEYESEGEEEWEEEPPEQEHECDEDEEDITQFFRPIEPHWENAHTNVKDRWSPSPSPSLETKSAPKLPIRRPMPDEEADAPPKQLISRKDDSILYPAPSPIRAKPKPTWSGDSNILSLISGLVAGWSDSSKNDGITNDATSNRKASPAKKGILKNSIVPGGIPHLVRPKPPRSVSFDSIFVREYERVVGDNPACGSGPPISIGWSYEAMGSTSLEEYECKKPLGRTKRELYLPASRRKDLLVHEWDFPEEELRQARREAQYIQYLRSKSAYASSRRLAKKPTADHSDTSQPSLRRETAVRAARYSPTPEIMRLHCTES